MQRLTLVVDVPETSVPAFLSYEEHVLPLLQRHGGQLERRLRTADSRTEVQVLSFADRDGYQAYLDDPERAAHRPLLDGSPYEQRLLGLLKVTDVGEMA